MSFEFLHSPQRAADAVKHSLRLDASCQLSESRSEILRTTVWSIAAPSSKAHVNRVLSEALPMWHLVSQRATMSDETLRAELRETLSALEDAGDLLELGGGYWAPATARFVELPERTGYLLVGGVPTQLLPVERDAVQYHGPHRHLAKLPSELATTLPVENVTSWARLPNISLLDWAGELLESLERQPYSPTNSDAFEFYVPGNCRPGTPQFKRWSASAGSTTGTLLARRTRIYGAKQPRLVDLQNGRIVSAADLDGVDVRRLMYELDRQAGNPVRAQQLGSEWLLKSELPRAEQRFFAAIGTLSIPEDRYWERRWIFSRNEERAVEMLQSLGIALERELRDGRR